MIGRLDPAWYVRETLVASFPPSVPIESRLVASLYTAYLDESGTHAGSDAAVVAGFVSNVTNWTAFSVEWQKALTDYGLTLFHMSEFENRRGEFATWSVEEGKARLNHFLGIINEHIFRSIGVIVLKKSFDAILTERAKRMCGDAYGLASMACFHNLAKRLQDPKVDGYLDYTMESGAKGGNVLQWMFAEGSKDPEWVANNRILALSFRDKRLFLPLQAADILAYELYKHVPHEFFEVQRPVRYPLQQLATKNHQWHFVDDAELRNVNEHLEGFWKRRATT